MSFLSIASILFFITSASPPVAAQAQSGPSALETLAYIKERCDGEDSGGNYVSYSFHGDFIHRTTSYSEGTSVRRMNIRALDLEASRIEGRLVTLPCRQGILRATCGTTTDRLGREYSDQSYILTCRDADRVLNALRHFQTLRGGPMEGDDPFA